METLGTSVGCGMNRVECYVVGGMVDEVHKKQSNKPKSFTHTFSHDKTNFPKGSIC